MPMPVTVPIWLQGFDEAIRGLAVGQTTLIEVMVCLQPARLPPTSHTLLTLAQASGGEWQPQLLFAVPLDHPEIQRLEGRYKK